MKSLLGILLGEDPREKYNPSKFHLETGTSFAPPQPIPHVVRNALPSQDHQTRLDNYPPPLPHIIPGADALPSPVRQPPSEVPAAPPPQQRLYGNNRGGGDMDNNPSAQGEPTPLGCWLVSQPGTMWPGRQDLKVDTIPLTSRVQISACNAPIGCKGTVALYEPESFMNPMETTHPVIATGSLINTYTGEVSDLFEDAMPPPDNGRDPGDSERERKQAQRRLMAAEGNVTTNHRKREQQDPIQPGDAGIATQLTTHQISADVSTEWNERACRDLYFNRNELAPTELEQTRNPFGFEGYNNRIRINPYLLPTQGLDQKDWVSNATILPGGDQRPKHKTKLRKDRPRTDYMGQVTGIQQSEDSKAGVRKSHAMRDEEGLVDASRCASAQVLYGDAAAVSSGQVHLSRDRSEKAPRTGVLSSFLQGASTVTASSVLTSLSGLREQQDSSRRGIEGAQGIAGAGTAQQASSKKRETEALGHHGFEGSEPAVSARVSQQRQSEGDDVLLQDRQRGFESFEQGALPGVSSQQRQSQGDDVLLQDRQRAFESFEQGALPGVSSQQRQSRGDDILLQERQRALDSFEQGALPGVSQQRRSLREDSVLSVGPRGMGDASHAVGAGMGGAQTQNVGSNDALTVDPFSIFTTLSSFDAGGLGMAQHQALGHADSTDFGQAPRMASAAFSGARPDASASDGNARVEMEALRQAGDFGAQIGSLANTSTVASRRQNLYGEADLQGLAGPLAAGMAAAQATEGLSRKLALDDRGNIIVMQGAHTAQGAHGAMGEMRVRPERSQEAQELSKNPHLNGGFVERNSAVVASNSRGQVLSKRVDNFKVGPEVDFQKKARPASREWRKELLTQPLQRRSSAQGGERSADIVGREPRRARPSKSPFRGHPLREKSGLASFLHEPAESRFEDDSEF